MKLLLDKEKLILRYKQGFGAWTYHLVIPRSESISGTWGTMKVFGKIDHHIIRNLNLAPRKNENKIISINQEIRKSIKKNQGEEVICSLYLLEWFDTEEDIENALSQIEH